ncbi:serine/threonine protein kinase [Mycolicibacterium rhodesiae NBB3]|uniref:non-specific serine/threonine protein kinase n=1 Tax=Mycolicibacterium rhodesiae (strain NBB3) TaxID=710685 RepID=G8RK15_MYCRN|nr:serine/threonine-protein kinase [Mycolicibacterium rhodesiae]AEV71040.1 serine/threonine protein kinase [Mycolicibacterium rhodesiae NBB3]
MNDSPHNSRVGSQLGPYHLNSLIGRGGMGEVYEAHDTVKGRTVALKLLPDSLSHDPVFRERLQREARAAGQLQEPHVVPIHDYGEIDGVLYVDMRLIDGTDLRSVLAKDGAMAPARAVWIVRQVAAALDAAHAAGITHRDVKPENILITADDFAYLVDFGIANAATDHTLTEKGTAIGTYAYMAPERFSSKPVTEKADVYALACVLHQCLTGQQPFAADSISMLITAHLIEAPPKPSEVRPDIPPAFDAIIAKGMAKDAADRYDSAGEFARAAAAVVGGSDSSPMIDVPIPSHPAHLATVAVGGVPVADQPTSAVDPPQTLRRNHRALFAGGAAVAGVIAVAALVAWLVARVPENSSTMSSTVTITHTMPEDAPNTVTAPNLTPAERQLMSLVPDPDSCTPNKDWANAIAAVDCKPTASGDGHEGAVYALYSDADRLEEDFNSAIADDQLTPCPGGDGSPANWDYDNTPDQSEGSLACGTLNGRADLVWTKTSDLMLGAAQGNDIKALYDWWVSTT